MEAIRYCNIKSDRNAGESRIQKAETGRRTVTYLAPNPWAFKAIPLRCDRAHIRGTVSPINVEKTYFVPGKLLRDERQDPGTKSYPAEPFWSSEQHEDES